MTCIDLNKLKIFQQWLYAYEKEKSKRKIGTQGIQQQERIKCLTM